VSVRVEVTAPQLQVTVDDNGPFGQASTRLVVPASSPISTSLWTGTQAGGGPTVACDREPLALQAP
jgi:hypothetical protein